ncbi:MAG: hypothetical protein A3H96_15015 [Acidobacteria bacterium RIFCSPLOWO2_02_FULL_67_36]|nr:MAG: hypothetical protein A3H96_15015 [Acidobacteria bacterium RIFCSPLOWO2_02_FULL_67_36]OFW19291.1 MAG: hypothetical protein A3G21_02215 [Acidobacteria bacterium RIFCSPLOWO2_12_FULL_66_21]
MPSPLGHALAGITAGLAVAPSSPDRGSRLRSVLLFGAAGAAADLDLIAGAHSGPTHGIGAAIAAGLLVLALRAVWTRGSVAPEWRLAFAVSAAYASHSVLDWLGTDTSPPIGIMALWPFTDRYCESSLHVFSAISRRYWLMPEFLAGNLAAVARELVILLPPFALVWRWKERRSSQLAARRSPGS